MSSAPCCSTCSSAPMLWKVPVRVDCSRSRSSETRIGRPGPDTRALAGKGGEGVTALCSRLARPHRRRQVGTDQQKARIFGLCCAAPHRAVHNLLWAGVQAIPHGNRCHCRSGTTNIVKGCHGIRPCRAISGLGICATFDGDRNSSKMCLCGRCGIACETCVLPSDDPVSDSCVRVHD